MAHGVENWLLHIRNNLDKKKLKRMVCVEKKKRSIKKRKVPAATVVTEWLSN